MNKSACVAASICGTPCASRCTITGAENPVTCTSPSSTGNADAAAERSHRTNPPAATTKRIIRLIAIQSSLCGQRRLRARREPAAPRLEFAEKLLAIRQQQNNSLADEFRSPAWRSRHTVLGRLPSSIHHQGEKQEKQNCAEHQHATLGAIRAAAE